jgi:gamma-glutamyl phosphate reductase
MSHALTPIADLEIAAADAHHLAQVLAASCALHQARLEAIADELRALDDSPRPAALVWERILEEEAAAIARVLADAAAVGVPS